MKGTEHAWGYERIQMAMETNRNDTGVSVEGHRRVQSDTERGVREGRVVHRGMWRVQRNIEKDEGGHRSAEMGVEWHRGLQSNTERGPKWHTDGYGGAWRGAGE